MTRAARIIVVIVGLALGGCFGPSPKATTNNPYETYTHVVPAAADGVPVRELACDDASGCSEFWMVQVTGSENWTRISGPKPSAMLCSRPWQYTVERGNASVLYNESRYTFDPEHLNTLIAENFWGVTFKGLQVTTGCPTVYGLHSYRTSPYPNRTMALGSYGVAKVTVYGNGYFVFGEGKYYINLGQKLVVSYARLQAEGGTTYYVQGGFEVVNLGPWSKGHLFASTTGSVKGPG